MKTLALVTLATLIATSAMAQEADRAYRGSGTRAGGPAYLLNSETGGAVKATRKNGNQAPSYQSGSGTHAGGPANELNTGGRLSAKGAAQDANRTAQVRQSFSGQRAGGSYRY